MNRATTVAARANVGDHVIVWVLIAWLMTALLGAATWGRHSFAYGLAAGMLAKAVRDALYVQQGIGRQ